MANEEQTTQRSPSPTANPGQQETERGAEAKAGFYLSLRWRFALVLVLLVPITLTVGFLAISIEQGFDETVLLVEAGVLCVLLGLLGRLLWPLFRPGRAREELRGVRLVLDPPW